MRGRENLRKRRLLTGQKIDLALLNGDEFVEHRLSLDRIEERPGTPESSPEQLLTLRQRSAVTRKPICGLSEGGRRLFVDAEFGANQGLEALSDLTFEPLALFGGGAVGTRLRR